MQEGTTIAFLRKAFSDYYSFAEHLEHAVRRLLADENAGKLATSKVTIKSLVDVYGHYSGGKEVAEQLKIVLATTYVLILCNRHEHDYLLWTSTEDLMAAYPSFEGADAEEQGYLLTFRNMLVLALVFVAARGNKIFLLKVVERLEGSNNEYVTGSGQKPAVTRRVKIYETEGGITAKRKVDSADSAQDKKVSKAEDANLVVLAPVMHRSNTFEEAVKSVHCGSTIDLDAVLQDFLLGTWSTDYLQTVELDEAHIAYDA
ncbi:hypothetical protein EON65_34025 [archaeon]|nr:MAG: hypothetical protein EON65_34025 [archaeon]